MENKWQHHISAKSRFGGLHLRELFSCRDMIALFVKRNITTTYKQTVLGPLWIFINPLLSTVVYNVVFTGIAGIGTDGTPSFLFYLCGNLIWTLFSGIMNANSGVLTSNAALFGKVYFPRLSVPVATCITRFFHFFIQLLMLVGFLVYFLASGYNVLPNLNLLLVPVLMLHTAVLATGVGLLLSAMTAKYRDLSVLVGFGTQLWMYATPVVYPLSEVPEGLRNIIMLNPMSPVVESFRHAFLGSGSMPWNGLAVSAIVTVCVFFVGVAAFNRVERTYLDTV